MKRQYRIECLDCWTFKTASSPYERCPDCSSQRLCVTEKYLCSKCGLNPTAYGRSLCRDCLPPIQIASKLEKQSSSQKTSSSPVETTELKQLMRSTSARAAAKKSVASSSSQIPKSTSRKEDTAALAKKKLITATLGSFRRGTHRKRAKKSRSST